MIRNNKLFCNILLVTSTLLWCSCAKFLVKRQNDTKLSDLLHKEDYSAETHCNFGVVFEERDDIGNAISEYRKSIELNPKLITAYVNMGNCYSKIGKPDSSEAYYFSALKLDSTNSVALNNLACLYIKNDMKIRHAIDFLMKAIKYDSTFIATYYLSLSSAYYKLSDPAESVNWADKALKVNSQKKDKNIESEAFYLKGLISYKTGKFPEALRFFRESLKITNDAKYSEEAKLLMAKITETTNNSENR